MVRTIEYFFIASLLIGIIATPGIGAIVLLLLPLLLVGFVWRSALTVANRGRPGVAVVRTRPSHLLGPGGPDDSFAAEGLSPSARNGVAQERSGSRPGLAALRSASTTTSHGEI
jgi:hypothetical protein